MTVRHLLVGFLALILSFGEVTLGSAATEHGHPLRGARAAETAGFRSATFASKWPMWAASA